MTSKHRKTTPKKVRESKYEDKLAIKGTLDDVLKISVPKSPKK